jgi:hypothetical protein
MIVTSVEEITLNHIYDNILHIFDQTIFLYLLQYNAPHLECCDTLDLSPCSSLHCNREGGCVVMLLHTWEEVPRGIGLCDAPHMLKHRQYVSAM